jgi:hypothetical protein
MMTTNNVIYKQNPSFWQEGAKQPTPMETVYYYDMEAHAMDDGWDVTVEEMLALLGIDAPSDYQWWEVTQDDKACSEHSYWSWEGFAFEYDTIISLDIADNYNPDLPTMPEILVTEACPFVHQLPVIYTKDVAFKLNIQHN